MSVMQFREPNEVLWRGVRPAHNGIQVTAGAAPMTSSTVVYTVTTGKTLYLTHYYFECYQTAVALKSCKLQVRNDSQVVQYMLSMFMLQAAEIQHESISFWPPIEIPSAWEIYYYRDAGPVSYVFLHGWEE